MPKLTKKLIEEAKGSIEGSTYVWDSTLPGFGVRINPGKGGKKNYIVQYRIRPHRKTNMRTIGPVHLMPLDLAREKARKLLLEAYEGRDPFAETRGQTFKELCRAYLEDYAKPKKKSWKKDASRIKRHFTPLWGSHTLNEIDPSSVLRWFNALSKESPYEANRSLELLQKMFGLAKEWELTERNPTKGISANKEKSRERWVSEEELPRLVAAIDEEEDEYIRAVFHLYLLTGLRKNELLAAKWEHYEKTKGVLKIPQTKTQETYYVPLSTQAQRIIEGLEVVEDSPWIFVSKRDFRKHITNLQHAWERILKRANIKDLRIHDLRHTVAAILVSKGESLYQVGGLLNHKDTKSTSVYAHLDNGSKRALAERLASELKRLTA